MNTTTIARRVRRITMALGLTLSAAAAVAAPVSLNVVDVAGNLQLTRGAIEAFKEKNPNLVSNVTFTNAPAP
ncbi:ABC transporter substrate-binding protein, partial [Paraburkholderia sp. SIMBA_009]